MSNALASWRLKSAGSRTYFFDLKETKTNNTYLQVTESKPKGKEEDGFEQNRIFLFSEDFEEWFKTMGEVYRHLKAHPDQANPPGRRDPKDRNNRNGANGKRNSRAPART